MAARSTRLAILALAGAGTLAALPGCITATDKFDTRAVVTPEPSIDVAAVVRRAKGQIIRRGGQLGLTIKEDTPGRLVLTSVSAPGVGDRAAGAGGMGGASPMVNDNRRIFAVAKFRTVNRTIEYRYNVQLRGQRPANTTDEHERDVLAGLFAVREIFEQPLNVDVKAVRDTVRESGGAGN